MDSYLDAAAPVEEPAQLRIGVIRHRDDGDVGRDRSGHCGEKGGHSLDECGRISVVGWRYACVAVSRRDGIAVAVGAVAATVVGTTAGWQYAPAAGWIATAAVYLPWTWAGTATLSAPAIELLVQQRRPGRRVADTVVVLASIASLAGVAYLLAASNVKGPDTTVAAVVGFSSVAASWLVVHTVYTLRYAIHYYTEPVGGVDFNQDEQPTVADFAYLAFTIAITYGVTDTALQSRPIRVTALQQALVSYLFGTVILALSVQVIGSLSGVQL